jgi:predicted nucleic acid-binding protein
MGLILDSSAVIAGERKGQTAAELLADLRTAFGVDVIALATVSVIELEHGIWRAKDGAQAERRRKFFEDMFAAVPTIHLRSISHDEPRGSTARLRAKVSSFRSRTW